MHRAVGYDVSNAARTQHPQAAYAHRATGRTIAVIVARNHDAAIAPDGLDQQFHRPLDATQRIRPQQAGKPQAKLVGARHAARRIHTLQHRVHTRRPAVRCPRDGAPHDVLVAVGRHYARRQKRRR